ncbi:ComEA family DNA-binding protein [Stutzerimonas kirkiae]|uniref:Competence protein ComEA n=1 Tax=Stutzerimonas kirkiae TaxID=2211392 RepID=A0A4Q9R881_9GAMM|nr:helix-hairpin-helix domain-containing protein [Stutzerimonas kirkiae]TBU96817.1 competence protein ComEA [Stutzerimonas kirkiae]TBV01056.1 competence protein ComEA [Stutzerimonas kirkiae]TBV08404.1 competence protein ComEA [Stutzerimonas kirkiae]TBV16675.1 competence protein ComEA [Stutzerimonas kirkiae]
MTRHFFHIVALTFLFCFSLATHAEPPNTATTAPVASEHAGMIDLNSADADTLARELSGIGASKAQAIVDYRDAHGPFVSVDELLEVQGIGSSILERNEKRLTVKP